MVAIRGPNEDSVDDHIALLGPGNEAFFSASFFVKPKPDWPSDSF